MSAGFRIRRVKSEQSIGDRLKRARVRRKFSISTVEEQTKIRAKFILALEADSWDQIPSEVYGRGYLETYAQYLQLPIDAVMKQYSRERDSYARRCLDGGVELAPLNSVRLPRFQITSRLITYVGSGLVLAGFIGVLGLQIQRFSAAPYLELATAQASSGSPDLVITSSTYTLNGRTAIGATVQINDKPINVGPDGGFSVPVDVQKGSNAITVDAINSKGKKTSEVINVVVK